MNLAATLWTPSYRIIPSRFPPIDVFERIADPADLDVAYALDALTNPRLRDEAGDLRLVPDGERISGPGSSYIMAAFTHLNPQGSRFSDGSFGVYYAGDCLETAIAETAYHAARRLAETAEPAQDLEMRVLMADLDAVLWDLRGPDQAGLFDPDPAAYGPGQAVARRAREAGVDGLLYPSVRHPGGECAAVLRPKVLARVRQSRHLVYPWDGRGIVRARICVKTLLP